MKRTKNIFAVLIALMMIFNLAACGTGSGTAATNNGGTAQTADSGQDSTQDSGQDNTDDTSPAITDEKEVNAGDSEEKAGIEEALDLANIKPEWTYSEEADAWTMAVVTAVTNAELPDYQGVSVCVPGAYVKGVDTDGDGKEDETEGTASGSLIIDNDAEVTSTNGQVYTATTAPVIINTGAAGYGSQSNQTAGTSYAKEGYINVACGNRGKQSTLSDGTYTGDAPSCLVDQKNAVRFVKYNILLGNLPGSVDYFVSTGGSGGGAHAAMLAATSNNPDFYDYEIAQGAVGVYQNSDGSYSTSVTVNGSETELSDGLWGCMAYSAITSLAEADMTLAFEYFLNPDYSFNTDFQKQLAEYLAAEYMEYINAKKLKVDEEKVGFDLNGNGDTSDTVELKIEYDEKGHEETNGYYGTYLDLYLAEFEESLQAYIDRLAYAEDWTWFNSEGKALSDSEVSAMTDADRAEAFINGWYVKGSTGSDSGGMEGGPGGGPGGDSAGGPPDMNGGPGGDSAGGDSAGGPPDMNGGPGGDSATGSDSNSAGGPQDSNGGQSEVVGTPDSGTTQSSTSKTDSANYSTFEEMLEAYQADIAEVQAGDAYGNNIVELYDPMRYIGADGTDDPTWTRILMGASEGDISMLNSLNMQIAWLNAGTDAEIEWQWNGGHVPSEIFGDSLALYVDTMYGEHVDGAKKITKAAASGQTANGDGTEPSGIDLSDWVSYDSAKGIDMTLAGAAAYRTSKASKATPGFDVMDYGQEDYVFGSSTADARHWDIYVLKMFEEYADTLKELFNR
ncbi:MAG: hypothetical protein K5673_07670 [Lachnospiraceae bacterium]|nr:hypothetical protein [Lachnospiraceae bacterium]